MEGMYILCCVFFFAGYVNGFPQSIPVGGIFDQRGTYTRKAFNYKTMEHNRDRKKQYDIEFLMNNTVDISDSYQLNATVCKLLSKGIFTLFGQGNQSSQITLRSLTEHIKMPHIMTASMPDLPGYQLTRYQVMLAPPYLGAMMDLIRRYKWVKAHYIYTDEKGLIHLEKMIEEFSAMNYSIQLDAHRLPSVTYAYETLRRIDKWDSGRWKCVIIDMERASDVHVLIKQIMDVGMNRQGYHYLLGGVNAWELYINKFKYGGARVTGFSSLQTRRIGAFVNEWYKYDQSHKGIGLTNLRHESALIIDAFSLFVNAMEYLKKNKPDIFDNNMRGAAYYNNNNEKAGLSCQLSSLDPFQHGDAIMAAIKSVPPFQGLTGRVKIGADGRRVDYTLDVIEVGLDQDATKTNQWSDRTGLKEKDLTVEAVVPKKAKIQVVSILPNPPYFMERKRNLDNGRPPTGNDKFEGYCKDLLVELSTFAKFEYTLVPVPDGNHGTATNGSWDGMIGELANKRADIAVGDLTINSDRERVVDFSKPFMNLGISIMIMKPQKQKPGVFSFMDPLDQTVWLCIVCAYIGVSLVLFISCKYSPYEHTDDFTLYNSLWFSLGCFMQQGADIAPSSPSARIAGSVWWFFTLIIISSYTANLAAFLTIEKMVIPVNSADELANSQTISYGTTNGGTTKKFFAKSEISVFKKMGQAMLESKEDVFVDTIEEGVKKVRTSKGKYAFLLDSPTNEYHNQKQPCNTMKVGNLLDSKGYGVACRNDNDYRNAITLAILKMREDGTLNKFKTRWWYDKGECGPPDGEKKGSTMSPLTLSNVSGIFYILIGGLGLSMVMSFVEIIYKSKMESKKRKTTFKSALKANSRLSIRGTTEEENPGITDDYPSPYNHLYDQFQYSPARYVMSPSYDGTQTQV